MLTLKTLELRELPLVARILILQLKLLIIIE
jgi:hypothetical protein